MIKEKFLNKILKEDNNLEEQYEIDELLNEYNEPQRDKINGKNFKQMSRDERIYLLELKNKALNNGIFFAKHALDRMEERYIREKDIIRALKDGQIIEYRRIKDTDIITIRGGHVNKYGEQVYVIFSLDKRKVITTYTNKQETAYKKMTHLDRYEENFKIDIPPYYQKRISFLYNN